MLAGYAKVVLDWCWYLVVAGLGSAGE